MDIASLPVSTFAMNATQLPVNTLADDFLTALPAMGATFLLSSLWWLFCHKWYLKKDHEEWLNAIKEPTLPSLIIARRGSPADRLFLFGLSIAGLCLFVYIVIKLAFN